MLFRSEGVGRATEGLQGAGLLQTGLAQIRQGSSGNGIGPILQERGQTDQGPDAHAPKGMPRGLQGPDPQGSRPIPSTGCLGRAPKHGIQRSRLTTAIGAWPQATPLAAGRWRMAAVMPGAAGDGCRLQVPPRTRELRTRRQGPSAGVAEWLARPEKSLSRPRPSAHRPCAGRRNRCPAR